MPPYRSPSMSETGRNRNNNVFVPNNSNPEGGTILNENSQNYIMKVMSNLNALRFSKLFCDVEVIAGHKIFNVRH